MAMHPTAAILESVLASLSMLRWDDVAAFLADDVEIIVKPRTLGSPVMGKEQFLREMKAGVLCTCFLPGALKYTIEEVYELKEGANRVIVRVHSEATSKRGTPWYLEYMFTMEADASGRKIKMWTEFIDSHFFQTFMEEDLKNAGGVFDTGMQNTLLWPSAFKNRIQDYRN